VGRGRRAFAIVALSGAHSNSCAEVVRFFIAVLIEISAADQCMASATVRASIMPSQSCMLLQARDYPACLAAIYNRHTMPRRVEARHNTEHVQASPAWTPADPRSCLAPESQYE